MRAAFYEVTGPAREVLHVGELPDPACIGMQASRQINRQLGGLRCVHQHDPLRHAALNFTLA